MVIATSAALFLALALPPNARADESAPCTEPDVTRPHHAGGWGPVWRLSADGSAPTVRLTGLTGAAHTLQFRAFLSDGTQATWTRGPFPADDASGIEVVLDPPDRIDGRLAQISVLATAIDPLTLDPVAHIHADPVFVYRRSDGSVIVADEATARRVAAPRAAEVDDDTVEDGPQGWGVIQ